MSALPIDVLLVEDNPDDMELALHAFRQQRLVNRVRVARDGAEALDLLLGSEASRIERPRLVLLDLKLPKVNGIEVLRRLRADPRTHFLPVVVLTASAQERDLRESYELGVNSYIVKPVDFEKFVDVVRQLGLYWLVLNKTPGGG
jgi:two-component system response regulator